MACDVRTLALVCGIAVGTSFATQAATDPSRQYRVTDVFVGSILPQSIVTGPVPFDSPYAALTAEQKAVLAQDYESLSPGDEPPFPLYGVRHLIRPLISFAENWNPVGSLVAAVEVDSKGDAVTVTVYKSPDPEITRIASSALAVEKYKPAECKGQPCRMEYLLRLDFSPRHGLPVDQYHVDPAMGRH
jgi:hypothetical protein